MSVTIPTTFETTDITVGEGIAAGQKITTQGLDTIASNHNFIATNYLPSMGDITMVLDGGFTTQAHPTTYQHLTGIPVLAEPNAKGMTFVGVFTNTDSDSASVRLTCGSNSGTPVTLAAGATAVTLTLTCATPAGSDFAAAVSAITQTSSDGTVKLIGGTFHWNGLTGSQSSSPLASGLPFAQTSQLQGTFPLTVEQYNRFLNGPYHSWKYTPQSMGSLVYGWHTRMPSTNSLTYSEITRFLLIKRRPNVKVTFCVLADDVAVRLTLNGTQYEKSCTGGGFPSNDVDVSTVAVHKFSEIDLSEMPSVMEVIVEHKTTGQANAKLFAINAVVTK